MRPSWSAALWLWIAVQAVGFTAGMSLGMKTIQVSSGREPEYETVVAHAVSDAARWAVAGSVAFAATHALLAGALLALVGIAASNRSGPLSTEGADNLRRASLIMLGIYYVAIFGLFFQVKP